MSHYQAAATHHHSSLNSIPQTHHPALPTSLVAPIKRENDSDDDDVVFLATVPKVEHTPEQYDPECKCSTCRLVRKLMAECTCGECRGLNNVHKKEGQAMRPNENATSHNEVSFVVQPSKSSIQSNAASTSEHILGNDDRSRSTTPDYVPRFFDVESGNLSSDDSEGCDHIDASDDMEVDQENESEDENRSDTFSKPNSSKSLQPLKSLHVKAINSKIKIGQTDCPQCKRNLPERCLGSHLRTHQNPGYRCNWLDCGFFFSRVTEAKKHVCADHLQVETANSQQINPHLVKVNPITCKTGKVQVRAKRTTLKASAHHSRPSTSGSHLSSVTNLQTTDGQANSSEIDEFEDNEKDKDNGGKTEVDSFDCPKCEIIFTTRKQLLRHYRGVHLEWKPYYCKWPDCDYDAGIHDRVVHHANAKHFNSDDRQQARNYVGIRFMSLIQKDPIYESLRNMVKSGKDHN